VRNVPDSKALRALPDVAGADIETVTLATSPRFWAIIEESRQRDEHEQGISTEEMRKRLGLD
jgi:hypothetical protein